VEEEPELTRRQLRRMRKRLQLDIVETDDAYFVEVNMPGVPKENVEVHVDHNNVLSIETRAVPLVTHTCGSQAFKRSTKEPQQGEAGAISTPTESPSKEAKKEEEQQGQPTESHNRKFLLSERQKGRMSRSIRLPKQADPEKVQTCLENGVLCLVFAKLPEHQVAHRIEVK
jgi:HSP20 family molecular chaperone IbpA